MKRIKRAKLFVFLRQHRHTLFDAVFPDELATIYKEAPQGQPPILPAQLALATILQAYTGVSADELLEATLMDRRWQPVLDCLDSETTPFSKGTLVTFRKRNDRASTRSALALSHRGTGRSYQSLWQPRVLQELRERQLTALGRAKLRERVAFSHSLAHIGQWQGERAGYLGERKNRFDLRRTAVVHNLHIIARAPSLAQAA